MVLPLEPLHISLRAVYGPTLTFYPWDSFQATYSSKPTLPNFALSEILPLITRKRSGPQDMSLCNHVL